MCVCVYIYSSSFYLATAQPQCVFAIGRDHDLSTRCHSCWSACQQRVIKMFSFPD